jgi:hypothetical protein
MVIFKEGQRVLVHHLADMTYFDPPLKGTVEHVPHPSWAWVKLDERVKIGSATVHLFPEEDERGKLVIAKQQGCDDLELSVHMSTEQFRHAALLVLAELEKRQNRIIFSDQAYPGIATALAELREDLKAGKWP